MDNELNKFIGVAKMISPKIFVNENNELIVVPKINIFFRLEDVKNELDFKCKVLSWLSRPSCKGVSIYWQVRILRIVNEYLETNFTKYDMLDIYTYLGNDVNRTICEKFIKSNYDFSLFNKV